MTALLFSALLCACSAKGTIETGEAVVIVDPSRRFPNRHWLGGN
jgi:hypothetical protein